MDLRKQAPTISAVCLTALTVLAIGGALYWLRPVLVPFVLAVFLSICVAPLVDFLRIRLRLPQTLAIVGTLLLGLVGLVALAAVAAEAVAQLNADQAVYRRQLAELEADLLGPLLLRFGVEEPVRVLESLEPRDGVDLIGKILGELLSIASDGAVVLIYLFFLLASHTSLGGDRAGTWFRIRNSIAQYISLKVAVSALTAFLVWATLAYFGVPLAVVFGLLTFALNFIPNVGSLIAILLPVPVVLMNPALGTASKVLAIAIPSTIQFVVGNLVEPRLMGRSLDLHPVVILLGLIVWGWLWGIVGVLLAVPLTSALKIVFEQLGYTKPIADLFAGRPGSGPQPT
jgi:AI-2 transport protein TqsA